MRKNYINIFSQVLSWVSNPFLIPTLGILIIMNNMPGLELYTSRAKQILFLIIFISTCALPLIFMAIVSFSPGFNKNFAHHKDRIVPYFFTSLSVYLGSQLLSKLPFPPPFQLLMTGICALLVILLIITVWWNISGYAAGVGGLIGAMLALIFKYGMELTTLLIVSILISGLVCSSRIYLNKHTPLQVYTGFGLSAMVMFSTLYYF